MPLGVAHRVGGACKRWTLRAFPARGQRDRENQSDRIVGPATVTAMDHAASPLQHLRTLLKLVELLFAPILALAARGQVGALSRAAERALARLERGFCDYMRRELVKQGFAHAADLADAWFLARLHGKRPNSDDAVSPEPKKAKYRSSSPLREGGRAKGGGQHVPRCDLQSPPPLIPSRMGARLRACEARLKSSRKSQT